MKNTYLLNKKRKTGLVRSVIVPAVLLIVMSCLLLSGSIRVSAGMTRQAEAAPTENERPVRILCYGDSNTYGYDPARYGERYPETVCWTGILQERLGDQYEILEEGKNGRTTGYHPSRTPMFPEDGPQDLTARLDAHSPVDMVVIMLGSNDCIPALELSARDVAAGLDILVTATEEWASQNQAACPRILIVAPPVPDKALLDIPGTSPAAAEFILKLERLGELYQKLAEKHGCAFADARHGIELSELDHLHLTEEGHKQMAELILRHICDS